jgi:uncharacterized protein (TIGR03435 family)
MLQTILRGSCLIALSALSWSQPQPAPDTPAFKIADVHVSAKIRNSFVRTSPVREGRYEVRNATMVDLIRIAYGTDTDKILGGPNWLELDRYDVTAKLPEGSGATVDTKPMLQKLLEDRFQLKLHKETKPLPGFALVLGKKPLLKEAAGEEAAGCTPEGSSGGRGGPGVTMLSMMSSDGKATTMTLGPGMTIHYICHNMTMDAFASGLRSMMGAPQVIGPNPVLNETGLKGAWNFDVRWSMNFIGPMMESGDRISISDAIEKQLGLKLDPRQIPTPVVVVDSVNRKPTDNSPEVAKALPTTVLPTEFEVADVKPSAPGGRGGRYMTQPGGRLVAANMSLSFLINRAFDANNSDEVAGMPDWANSERFDVTAKAPAGDASASRLDDALPAMMLALLKDRFKLTYHKEDRQVSAYTLVAAKPKLHKADPNSRTNCKNGQAPSGSPGTRMLTCQNVTMAEFAERLQNMGPGLNWPVIDATGLEGGWDLNVIFNQGGQMMFAARGGGEMAQPVGAPAASDPSGMQTIFEAVEKQLGLKLESRKRTAAVVVIDHIEQKPTEN